VLCGAARGGQDLTGTFHCPLLGRKFVRVSLGGVRDEAEIRGHRRTYIGALPGRIIKEIYRCGSNNPVLMLDEIDKLSHDFRGDPSSALLEVLDPEQNFSFQDHYLDVPFDLSKVMFITTANQMDPIPGPLKDRMEIIRLAGYSSEEKQHIANRFIIPREIEENGLAKTQPTFTEEGLIKLIREYTREAGVRNLQRTIAQVLRKLAKEITQGKELRAEITPELVAELLGPRKFHDEVAAESDRVGVVTGLAWTETGGDILFIEATSMPGKAELILTGSLGDVMKESARAALSYIQAHAAEFGIPDGAFENRTIHIHVPSGAIPKDGPSAGVTMVTALVSLLTGKPARRTVAMTGEITLTGRVLAIGGLKEKVLAAHRAGVKTVLAPTRNRDDLEDIPDNVRNELEFIFIDEAAQAVEAVL
jgi:ATP-dependent Lon protease